MGATVGKKRCSRSFGGGGAYEEKGKRGATKIQRKERFLHGEKKTLNTIKRMRIWLSGEKERAKGLNRGWTPLNKQNEGGKRTNLLPTRENFKSKWGAPQKHRGGGHS